MTATKIGSSTFPRSACSPLTMCLVSTIKTALPKSPTMPRWATKLPESLDKFKREAVMSISDAASFGFELRKIGDRYLAQTYLALPAIHRASAYGELLEREMVDRFCDQKAKIPPLALVDD